MSFPHSDNLERFSELWSDAEPLLKVYLSGVIYNYADAEDLLQKTAIRAFEKFDSYNSELPFRGWVMGIAKFEVLGFFRDKGRSREYVDSETAQNIAVNIEDKATRIAEKQNFQAEAIKKAVSELPEKQQLILKLRYNDGLSTEDVALKMNMQPGAIRTILTRIRQKLKEAVMNFYEREEEAEL